MLEAKGFPKEQYAQAESFSLGGGVTEALLAKQQRCGPLAATPHMSIAAPPLPVPHFCTSDKSASTRTSGHGCTVRQMRL